jgi:predicted ester cyclase
MQHTQPKYLTNVNPCKCVAYIIMAIDIDRTMEENKQMVKEIVEHYSQKELDKSLALYPAFSDFKVKVREQIAIGNKVVSKWIITALHTGIFLGISPSGKEVSLKGISIHRVDKNKVIEDSLEMDFNDLVQQISS